MIKDKKILAVIPARGGSKGIPHKNIVDLGGKPLIAWTLTEAEKSKYIDRLILSSEDSEIIAVAKKWGCEVPFKRPENLAKDDTSSIDVIIDVLDTLEDQYDFVLILQPTSPLRTVEDIDGAIELAMEKKALSVVSFCEVSKSPYWMFILNSEGRIEPFSGSWDLAPRRQDLPTVLIPNGAVFISEVLSLKRTKSFYLPETVPYIMPQARSVDIDTPEDLKYVQFRMDVIL